MYTWHANIPRIGLSSTMKSLLLEFTMTIHIKLLVKCCSCSP